MNQDRSQPGRKPDITDSTQSEETLRELALKYRSLVEQSLVGIFIIQDERVVHINSVLSEKSGYSLDELSALQPQQLKELIHPDDRDVIWSRMLNHLAGKMESSRMECRFIAKDGSIYWMDVSANTIQHLGKPAIQVLIMDITDRKMVEQALQESEERFRSLVEKSSDVVIVIGKDSAITYISPSFKSVFKRDLSELSGKSALDFVNEFVHPDDIENVLKGFQDCIVIPGAEIKAEFRFKLLDGSWLNLEVIGKNYLNTPSIQGLVVNIRDITGRRQAEDALQASEERFRSLVEKSLDIIIVVDKDFKITYVSPSYQKVVNRDPSEILGKSSIDFVTELVHPDDVKAIMGAFGGLIENPSDEMRCEFRFRSPDGGWLNFEAHGKNHLDNPSIQGLIATLRDITERKKAETTLQANAERFRTLIEKATNAMIIMNADGKIMYGSESTERITGYKIEEWIGTSIMDLMIHPDDLGKIAPLLADVLKTPDAFAEGVIARFKHKDGAWHTLEANARNLLNDPSVNGIVINYRDITERKMAEEALQANEDRFRTLIENAADAIVIVDANGKIIYESNSMEKITGYKLEDWIGTPVQDWIIDPDDMTMLGMTLADIINKPGSIKEGVQARFKHKDGSWHILEATIRNLLNDPNIKGLVVNYRDVTERKMAEYALRSSEEKYRNLVETERDVIVSIDAQGFIKTVNSAVKSWGYTPDEVLKMNFQDLIAPEKRESTAKELQSGLQEGGDFLGETIAIDKQGQLRPIEYSAVIIKEQGQFTGAQAIVRDITERKKLEQKYRDLVENISHIVFDIDAEGTITYISPAVELSTGYKPSDLLNTNFTDYVYPEDMPFLLDNFKKVLDGTFVDIEVRWRMKYGDIRWFRTTAKPILDNNKKVTGAIGVMSDITERKRAEQALQETEERYKSLFDRSLEAIYIADLNGNFIDANPYARKLLGYEGEDITSLNFLSLLDKEDIEKMYKNLEDVLTIGHQRENAEYRLKRKDGTYVWVETEASLLYKDGKTVGIQGIARDITERKNAELALAEYRNHLEDLVAERTEELNKAKDIAEKASKAKSEFLANMSHEIRTPLSSIIGFSELLYDEIKGPINDDQKKYLGYVASSGQHLLSLINDILDLSKVEAGKMELQVTKFSINELLKNSFSFITEKAVKHNIKLLSQISADVGTIEADERKVKQIVYNLISNSVKFTPDGGSITLGADIISSTSPAIPAKIRKELTEKNYVLVSIKDTGIGIAKKNQSKLFNEFYQLEDPHTKKYEGTGLGLALSKRLVVLHGGNIWFESEGKGKGCTFYFILPLKQDGKRKRVKAN